MTTASAIVALIATLGWLVLNVRALRAHRLSFEQTMMMGVAWAILFAGLAFVLSRLGF